eukprot:1188199-Prorocentrum_minimum.AAC.2
MKLGEEYQCDLPTMAGLEDLAVCRRASNVPGWLDRVFQTSNSFRTQSLKLRPLILDTLLSTTSSPTFGVQIPTTELLSGFRATAVRITPKDPRPISFPVGSYVHSIFRAYEVTHGFTDAFFCPSKEDFLGASSLTAAGVGLILANCEVVR